MLTHSAEVRNHWRIKVETPSLGHPPTNWVTQHGLDPEERLQGKAQPEALKRHWPFGVLHFVKFNTAFAKVIGKATFDCFSTKIIYIMRNPKDTAISLKNFMESLPFMKHPEIKKFFPSDIDDFVKSFVQGSVFLCCCFKFVTAS